MRRFPGIERLGPRHVGLRQPVACGQVVAFNVRAGCGERRRQSLGICP